MTIRNWECGCGNKFAAPVVYSKFTANLSSEATVYCPRCGSRPLCGSPHLPNFTALADFLLCGCLYAAFEREGFDRTDAVCHRVFQSRFKFWQNITLDGHLPAKWVDNVVVTLMRGNTTAR